MSGRSIQMGCREARQVDIVDYLGSLGHKPEKIRGNSYWFLSPLRIEKTASFKVDRIRNRWYDFGEGRGGNFIDFAVLYYGCTVAELLAMLNGHGQSFQTSPAPATPNIPDNKIVITAVSPLRHPALLQYCAERCIDPLLAKVYCGQAYYLNNGKRYFAIGFKNSLGGYELRNAYFKGSSAPKAITLMEHGSSSLAVFEGFFDFLSYLMLCDSWGLPAMDYLILNSLSFFESSLARMDKYSIVNLFLDNNAAGQSHTQKALAIHVKFKDQRFRYCSHEDLNEYLCYLGISGPIILKPP